MHLCTPSLLQLVAQPAHVLHKSTYQLQLEQHMLHSKLALLNNWQYTQNVQQPRGTWAFACAVKYQKPGTCRDVYLFS